MGFYNGDVSAVECTSQCASDLQDEGGSVEEAGPLAEISFWRERSADLSSLRTQLDSLSAPPSHFTPQVSDRGSLLPIDFSTTVVHTC